MKKIALALAAFFLLTAQTPSPSPPYVYPVTLGTSQAQILAANPARKRLVFINPNAAVTIAVCPAGPRRDTGATFTCAVNSAGSVTLQPYGSFVLDGGAASGPPLAMGSAWNAVAASPSSALTIMEFE